MDGKHGFCASPSHYISLWAQRKPFLCLHNTESHCISVYITVVLNESRLKLEVGPISLRESCTPLIIPHSGHVQKNTTQFEF